MHSAFVKRNKNSFQMWNSFIILENRMTNSLLLLTYQIGYCSNGNMNNHNNFFLQKYLILLDIWLNLTFQHCDKFWESWMEEGFILARLLVPWLWAWGKEAEHHGIKSWRRTADFLIINRKQIKAGKSNVPDIPLQLHPHWLPLS